MAAPIQFESSIVKSREREQKKKHQKEVLENVVYIIRLVYMY